MNKPTKIIINYISHKRQIFYLVVLIYVRKSKIINQIKFSPNKLKNRHHQIKQINNIGRKYKEEKNTGFLYFYISVTLTLVGLCAPSSYAPALNVNVLKTFKKDTHFSLLLTNLQIS